MAVILSGAKDPRISPDAPMILPEGAAPKHASKLWSSILAYIVKLEEGGRIRLPKELCEAHGLVTGSRIKIEVDAAAKRIILTPIRGDEPTDA